MNLVKATLPIARRRILRLPGLTLRVSSTKPVQPRQFSEEPDYYRHGGFHSVSLGDTLNSKRYTILRKLGYGQYSTVWLARDSKCQRYVALKVLTAACYGTSRDIFEREILSKILEVSRTSAHPGRNHTSHLLDESSHTGPNGDHVCLVFDVLGQHLGYQVVEYQDGRLPVKSVKEIARQLLQALDFLHTECDVIHADLKPTNFLLELETPDKTISEYLESTPPRTTDCQNAIPLQEAMKTPLLSEMASLRVRLIDFGVSSWRHKHLADLLQPVALRAPEVIVGAPWDTGVDIWSLGCGRACSGQISFLGGAPKGAPWSDEEEHLAKIIALFGPFLPSLLQKGRRSAEFFDEQGTLIRHPGLLCLSLEQFQHGRVEPFVRPSDMPETEVDAFIDFVKSMLTIDPAARKSAAELLQHEWLA